MEVQNVAEAHIQNRKQFQKDPLRSLLSLELETRFRQI